MRREQTASIPSSDGEACVKKALSPMQNQERQEEHPSVQREDVSNEALVERFAPRQLKASSIMASAVALAAINLWLFTAQFQPGAFVFDGAFFSQLILFQDISFACVLITLAVPLVITTITVRTWFKVGTVFLGASPVWICFYMGAIMLKAPLLVLQGMTIVAHLLFGISVGMAFCNWVRFFVRFSADIPLQIGLAIVFSALASLGLSALPLPVQALIVTLLPLVIMGTLFHLRTVARCSAGISSSDITEGHAPIKSEAGLWGSLAVVGLVYGCCFGFAMSDYSVMKLCATTCAVAMMILGAVITAYFLKTGKNLGYNIQAISLLAFTAAGQGLLAIFEHDYLAGTFSLLFIGQFLFSAVLLLQLPRVYARTRTLRTFFALLLVFYGCQYAGALLRNLLTLNVPELWFRGFSAVLLCLAIGVMAFTLHDTSVSTVWGLLPVPTYPRKKYARACEWIKQQYSLTPREMEIMMMVGRGRNGTFIQEKLLISKSTYQTHMRNLYKKLDIHSDQELIDHIEFALDKLKNQ